MKKISVLIIACILFIIFLITGCASDTEDSKIQINSDNSVPQVSVEINDQSSSEHEDDIVTETPYGDLYFPRQWGEFLRVEQVIGDNTVEVLFSAKINDNSIPLFSITIGGDTGDIAGTLTAKDGISRNVYVRIEEIAENDSLSQIEQKRVYAMQEDLNYLIDNLK